MAILLTECQEHRMAKKRLFAEDDLAALAKKFRAQSGKTKAQIAREFGVTRATMQDVEERPEKNLIKLRCRIIEACSPFRVSGPGYWLERK